MSSSKLLELLSRMSRRQMATLEDLVHSPFFNKNAEVRQLFTFLGLKHPDFNGVDRKSLAVEAFPKQQVDDLKVRHLMSILLALAEKALVLPELFAGPEIDRRVAETLGTMDLPKHYRSALRRYEGRLKKAPGLSPALSYESYRHGLVLEHDPQRKQASDSLEDAYTHLDEFYLSSKLRQTCVSISRKHGAATGPGTAMLEEILSYLQKHPPRSPLVHLYFLALQTQLEPGKEEHFKALKAGLLVQDERLSPELAKELHILARNYCIRRMNDGHVLYTQELFDLYRSALSKGLLHATDGHFSPASFKNIVSTGLKLRAFSEVEAFSPPISP